MRSQIFSVKKYFVILVRITSVSQIVLMSIRKIVHVNKVLVLFGTKKSYLDQEISLYTLQM